MKKALIYASVASMIQQFNMENINILLSLGYEVHVACNMEQGSNISMERIAMLREELKALNVSVYHIPIPRKITAPKDIWQSYKITKKLLGEQRYDLVHCHSPIGGIICRLANRTCKHYKTTRMIYTAHGFHFYEGAPLKNWLIYYPIEKISSKWTDALITINPQDFSLAQKKMKAKQVVYIPGVGISVERFANAPADKIEKRQELGVPADAFLLMSVGELNTNKNHAAIIKAIHQLNNPDVYYAIIGNGNQDTLKSMIDSLGLSGRVMLLGYRTDIPDLYKAADVFAFPSKREGLGLAAVEAMAAGLPLITSNINGINDYSIDGITGYSRHSEDVDGFADCIRRCMSDREWLERTGKSNIERSRKYDRSNVNEIMIKLYRNNET